LAFIARHMLSACVNGFPLVASQLMWSLSLPLPLPASLAITPLQ